jgi:hypothetical protein
MAENRLNEVDGVTKQEKEVLAALAKCGRPVTAKALGVVMANEKTGVPYMVIEQIIRIAGIPHRRLKVLVDDERVIVEKKDGKRVYRSV